MRLGGPVFASKEDWSLWAEAHSAFGYRACYCPLNETSGDGEIEAFRKAVDRAGLIVAEVGAWSNPISLDDAERERALELCRRRLDLAEKVGATCCVNIAGSRGPIWDGPYADNLTADTFDLIVASVRAIIDAVQPRRTHYTLETMPWIFPDSPESYGRLLRAIDRPAFGVHLDPVNLITSPRLYFGNADLLRECFARLGPHIKSCHAKDILLESKLTVRLLETRPGLGNLDYRTFLKYLSELPKDVPVMLEHLKGEEEYRLASVHIHEIAQAEGIAL